jgi:hypothetical protein
LTLLYKLRAIIIRAIIIAEIYNIFIIRASYTLNHIIIEVNFIITTFSSCKIKVMFIVVFSSPYLLSCFEKQSRYETGARNGCLSAR